MHQSTFFWSIICFENEEIPLKIVIQPTYFLETWKIMTGVKSGSRTINYSKILSLFFCCDWGISVQTTEEDVVEGDIINIVITEATGVIIIITTITSTKIIIMVEIKVVLIIILTTTTITNIIRIIIILDNKYGNFSIFL